MNWRKGDQIPRPSDFQGFVGQEALVILTGPVPSYAKWSPSDKVWQVMGLWVKPIVPWIPLCEVPGPEVGEQK